MTDRVIVAFGGILKEEFLESIGYFSISVSKNYKYFTNID